MTTQHPGRAWRDRARDLAVWTYNRLAVRDDAHGGYRADGARTTVKLTDRPNGLKRALLRHYAADAPVDVIGLHAMTRESVGRWCAPEIDFHGDGTDDGRNERFALAMYAELRGLGFRPLLTASNGRGGYHLRVLFDRDVPGAVLFAFAKWMARRAADFGVTPPETFPKQHALSDRTPYGNWLRLPGRHHTRDYWSHVYDGEKWVEGAEAVDHILGLPGDTPAIIPADVRFAAELLIAPKASPAAPPVQPEHDDREPGCAAGDREHLLYRGRRYATRQGNRSEGGGRNNAAYKIAAFCRGTLGLTVDEADAVLTRWNAGNTPPLETGELHNIVTNAGSYNRGYQDEPRKKTPKKKPAPPLPTTSSSSPGLACTSSSKEGSHTDEVGRAPARTPAIKCRCGKRKVFEGKGLREGQGAVFYLPCRRYSCGACCSVLRDDWKKKLVPVVRRSEEVATWEGDAEEFAALRAHLRRLVAAPLRYVTVKLKGGRVFGLFLNAPASKRLTPVAAKAAAELLREHLDTFPVMFGSRSAPFRPVHVSYGFLPDVPEQKAEGQWRPVGPCHLSPREIAEVLSSYKVPAHVDPDATPDAGRGRAVTACWAFPDDMPAESQAEVFAVLVGRLPVDRTPDGGSSLSDLDDWFEDPGRAA